MNRQIVHDVIELDIPDHFVVYDGKKMEEYFDKKVKNTFVAREENIHCTVLISWSKPNLFNRNKSLKDILAASVKTLNDFTTNFQYLSDQKRNIGGMEAEGFRYCNVVRETRQVGEYLLIKYNNYFYTFCCLGRPDCFEDNYPYFVRVLDSVALK